MDDQRLGPHGFHKPPRLEQGHIQRLGGGVRQLGVQLAAGGQGMPPADLTTFVVCGMIGSMYSRKVDPVKAMLYCMPMCISLTIVGMVFLYI